MPLHKEWLSVYLCWWLRVALLLILLACLDNLAQSKQNFLFHYVQFSCPNNYEVKYNETTNAQKVFVNGGNPHTTLPLFHPSDFKPVFLPKLLSEEWYRLLSFPRCLSTINIIEWKINMEGNILWSATNRITPRVWSPISVHFFIQNILESRRLCPLG